MSKFKTVAVFSYPAEALPVKGKLESEQIDVFLKDEFTVAADPLVSNAIGGIKMQVYKEDFVKAMGIIADSNPDLVKHRIEYINCPHCGKNKTRERRNIETARNFSEKLDAIWINIVPFFSSKDYQCKNCNTKFDLK